MNARPTPPHPGAGPAGPTVGSTAAEPGLGLTVLVGGEGLSQYVLAAHTSELSDPTPWLHGGELLMTTGLTLDTAPAALRAYVDRLAAAGVACLAVGTGPALTHAKVPAGLVAAALRRRLPLLEVPERTPFLAVTETVFARLAAAQYAEQVRALDAQRALTAAAVHPGGVQAVTGALARLSAMTVLVTDATGTPVASAGPDVPVLVEDLAGELDRLRAHGMQATASVLRPGRDVRVQPLGSHRLRGFLACAASTAPGPFERQLVAGAVGLLTLELERLRGAGEADRRRRADVATALLAAHLPDTAAGDLLASVGLRPASVRAVVLDRRRLSDVERVLERLTRELPGLLAVERDHDLVVLVTDPPPELVALVTTAVGAVPCGVGGPVRPGAAARSAGQASRAARLAEQRGHGAVDVTALAGTVLLLALDASAPGAVASYATAVLGPLDRQGDRGQDLARSVRAFLECNGSNEQAAVRLGVHRHTLRQRLRRVEELTGRRLDSGRDRMELLLAFEARDLGLPD